ncbi:MAG TPA: hypothetical protein VKV23_07075 [Acidimicrobiales bacterium]|nr:hypothetical protein [Acidimicrobiales bacterium]
MLADVSQTRKGPRPTAATTHDDGYGGDALPDRLRSPNEVIGAIRAAVGEDFVVGVELPSSS